MVNGQPWQSNGAKQVLARIAEHPHWKSRKQWVDRGQERQAPRRRPGPRRLARRAPAHRRHRATESRRHARGAHRPGGHRGHQYLAGPDRRVRLRRGHRHGRITTGDTDVAPMTGLSAGSKTIYTVGAAVHAGGERRAQADVRDRGGGARGLGRTTSSSWTARSSCAACPTRASRWPPSARRATSTCRRSPPVLGKANPAFTQQAPASRPSSRGIEVDPDTGEVTLLDFVVVQDVGQGHQPAGRRGPDAGRGRAVPSAWR